MKIPDYVKEAQSVTVFKSRLEDYKSKNQNKPDNFWELSNEIFNRINDSKRSDYVEYLLANPNIANVETRNINVN